MLTCSANAELENQCWKVTLRFPKINLIRVSSGLSFRARNIPRRQNQTFSLDSRFVQRLIKNHVPARVAPRPREKRVSGTPAASKLQKLAFRDPLRIDAKNTVFLTRRSHPREKKSFSGRLPPVDPPCPPLPKHSGIRPVIRPEVEATSKAFLAHPPGGAKINLFGPLTHLHPAPLFPPG